VVAFEQAVDGAFAPAGRFVGDHYDVGDQYDVKSVARAHPSTEVGHARTVGRYLHQQLGAMASGEDEHLLAVVGTHRGHSVGIELGDIGRDGVALLGFWQDRQERHFRTPPAAAPGQGLSLALSDLIGNAHDLGTRGRRRRHPRQRVPERLPGRCRGQHR
jgi:hypothetical protein